jgi:hypothetical protein
MRDLKESLWIAVTFLWAAFAVAAAPALLLPLAPAEAEGAAPVVVTREQVARFEGVWAGRDNPSPFGPIPFAMDFQWQGDGSLRSLSSLSRDTWVDLRFAADSAGNWVLHESAQLAGQFLQGYPMHPERVAGDTLHYAYREDPGFLRCALTADGATLDMMVRVRGEEHVRFHLARLAGEEATRQRRELIEARTRSGEDDLSFLGAPGAGDDPPAVANARVAARLRADDPQAHLAYGRALAEALDDAPPAKRIGYAQDMLASFRRAVALDSTLVDARYALAQYYLEAPPIAGGSLEAAASEAAALARLASPYSEVVRAQIEAEQGDRAAAAARLAALLETNPDLTVARRLYVQYAGKGNGVGTR